MKMKNQSRGLGAASAALFAALVLTAGCGKKDAEDTTAPAKTPKSGGAAVSASGGQAVYANNGCSRCHALNGQGGRMGPDLSHAGAGHDAQWIIAHVKNPKTHNPASRMPASEGKINDADLSALGSYLASLK